LYFDTKQMTIFGPLGWQMQSIKGHFALETARNPIPPKRFSIWHPLNA